MWSSSNVRRLGIAASVLALSTNLCPASANSGLDLDLSSPTASIVVTEKMLRGTPSQVITVGGEQKTLMPGSVITAGEYSALRQVASHHAQNLILDVTGVATGGQARVGSNFNSVVIPENVTLIANAARGINVAGDLTANGTLFGQSSVPTTFNVNAGNISIGSSGTITTVVPVALQGIIQQSNAVNLNIVSAGNVINHGAITSSGSLSILASGSVLNSLSASVAQATSQSVLPAIMAQNDVSIASAVGNIVNSGIINSVVGNVNLSSIGVTNLLVNNVSGLVSAQNGSINVRDQLFAAKALTTISGGDFLSQSLNIFGGNGAVAIDVKQITGLINVVGGEAHLAAETPNLKIGSFALSGDPSIINTAGDITLSPNSSTFFPFQDTLRFTGEHLAVIASGNILGDPNLYLIDTGSGIGDGGDLTLLAGFDAQQISGSEWQLLGPSATGGSVYLPQVILSSSATGINGTAGNITAAAHDGSVLINAAVADGGSPAIGVPGTAGSIKLIGQLGVGSYGPLEAVGLTRDGTIQAHGFEPVILGNLIFNDGKPVGGSIESQFGPDIAPVVLLGNLSASSKPDNGGLISIAGTGDVNIGPNTFLNSSGALSVLSGDSIFSGGGNDWGASTDLIFQLVDYTDSGRGPGDIELGANSTYQSGLLTAAINDYGKLTFGNDSRISSGFDTVLASTGDLIIKDSAPGGGLIYGFDQVRLMSQSGSLSVGTNNPMSASIAVALFGSKLIDIRTGSPIDVGALAPGAPSAGLLATDDVALPGLALLISEGSINLNSNIHTIGENILVGAFGLRDDGIGPINSTGNITLGNGTSFVGNGGYVTLYANGDLTGNNNTFSSTAWGDATNFTGGLVQVASGFAFSPDVIAILPTDIHNSQQLLELETPILQTSSQIASYAGVQQFGFQIIDPTSALTNLSITSNGLEPGVVQSDQIGTSTFNISGNANLQRGALFLDAVGDGHTLNLQNAQFNVTSYDLLPTAFGAADLLGTTQSFFSRLRGLTPAELDSVVASTHSNLPSDFDFPVLRIGSTVSQLDQQSQQLNFILTRRSDFDLERSGASGEAIRNGVLLGNVSVSSSSSFASMFSNFGIVDTGKTEPTGGGRGFSLVSPDGMPAGIFGSLPAGMNGGPGNASLPTIRVDQRQPDLMLFTTANQVVRGDMVSSPGAIAVGSEGTAVSTEEDRLLVHTGSVVADTENKPLSIVTKTARIDLGKDSTAVIVVAPDRGIRVVAVAGHDTTPVKIRPHGGDGNQVITLLPGEQVVIAEPKTENASSTDERGMYYACKSSVNLPSFTATELSGFSTASIRLSGTKSDYTRMLNRINQYQKTLVGKSDAAPPKIQVSEPAKFIASDGSLVHQEADGAITVVSGSVFMTGVNAETIRTEFGDVKSDKNSLLAVDASAGRVRIRACSGPDDIKLLVGETEFPLAPGQEVLIADSRPTKREALGTDGIGRRKLEVAQLSDSTWSVAGEFSIASLLSGQTNLDKMKTLRRKQAEVYAKMMKTTACVELATPKHGRYFAAPRETTLNYIPSEVFRVAQK